MTFVGIFLWLLGAGTLLYGQLVPQGPPDAVFYNGKVITVDSAFSVRQAVAVRGDRFLAVGRNAEMRALAGQGTRLVDLHGRAVIPGLMDNHYHLQRAAFYITRRNMLDMMGVNSLPELLDRLRKAVSSAGAKPEEVLIASGGWDLRGFRVDRRGPTRQELDQIAPQNPLVVIRSRNLFFLNSAALKALGVSRDTKELGGIPIRKDEQGEPTGAIAGARQLNAVMQKLFPPLTDAENRESILKMQEMTIAAGLTSIRDLSIPPEIMRIYSDFRREGKLKLRVSMGLNSNDYGVPAPDAAQLEEMLRPWGVGPGFGDDWLRLDCVAELTGSGNFPVEKLRPMMLVLHKYGWRPSIHISEEFLLGEPEPSPVPQLEQLDRVLDAYEAADRVSPIRDRRWVLEHVPQMRPDQMDRIARLGVLISAQHGPYFDGPEMVKEWGKERADRVNPLRDWLDRKLVVSTGTDWPGRDLNPFLTIYYLVTRRLPDGTLSGVSQKISREEALRIGTINNAYVTFEEKTKGSIEPGKLADFLILSGDLLTVPEDQIPAIHPIATYVGGRKVFATPEGNSY